MGPNMCSNLTVLPRRILARQLFDGLGAEPATDQIVTLHGDVIHDVAPFRAGQSLTELAEYDIVTPGLIDIQINGANDVQFNADPSLSALRQIASGAAQGGTAWLLPTFVTAHGQAYVAAIDAVTQAIAADVPGILGLHLEGPFLSPHKPGIHDATAIRALDRADLSVLTQTRQFPLLLTLAPECTSPAHIAELTAAGVTVFAGHSAARFDEMKLAQAAGLRGATHLFNAMSQMTGREPGVVGAVLGLPSLYAGLIADGHHVHWNNIQLTVRMMPDHLCLVTDAMCTLAGTLTEFELNAETIALEDGRLTNVDGTLAGAHIAMDESLRNMMDKGLVSPAQAVKCATKNPADALNMSHRLGQIKTGFAPRLSVFTKDWTSLAVV